MWHVSVLLDGPRWCSSKGRRLGDTFHFGDTFISTVGSSRFSLLDDTFESHKRTRHLRRQRSVEWALGSGKVK
jgi:hypothetical protein